MTDNFLRKPIKGVEPTAIFIDEVPFMPDKAGWTCRICERIGSGMESMFKHARWHLDMEGSVELDMRDLGHLSIAGPLDD